jgi:single-stranded-DNA-specific exonuclease
MAVEKIWKFKRANDTSVQSLHESLGINKTLCQILVHRGIDSFDKAKQYFRPSINDLHDPFLMKGMDKAIQRITNARDNHEKIMIYGDYDVDGTTSVAIVYHFLKNHYCPSNIALTDLLTYYIPHRYNEGYGVSFKGIDEAAALGCTLIITLDCGTKAIDKIAYAKSLGIDVIVCDHHTPSQELPPAYALLNPKQKECEYPFKELSACGIGYKLISALATSWNLPAQCVHMYLDLVATSIAADIVPIVGENRVLAFCGLEIVNSSPCYALQALKKLSNYNKILTISDLVFIISPRINAAGRMDDAKKAVALFLSESLDEAEEIASILQLDNDERREIDKTMTAEALDILESDIYRKRKSTVLFKNDWHKGVVGIVASRIIDHYYKPTIVLTASHGKATGSARSVVGFNIHDAIQECAELLDSFGGHFFAAGMTMPIDNVAAFIEKFEKVVANSIQEDSLLPIIEIDAIIKLQEINFKFYNIIKQMQPFGPENMKPIFCIQKVKNRNSKIVKDTHIKFDIVQEGKVLSGIGFNMSKKFHILNNATFDLICTIEENEWQGNTTLQLRVLDIK